MKIIATTKTGFIAEITKDEARRVTGKPSPDVGDEGDVTVLLQQKRMTDSEVDRLRSLPTVLDEIRGTLDNLRQKGVIENGQNRSD